MFHIQLRHSVNLAREFNLTEEDLRRRIVEPWLAGEVIASGDRNWAPERAKLTIYEAPRLRPDEIGMGRGWGTVTKHGTDVTSRMLQRTAPPGASAPPSVTAPPAGVTTPPEGDLERCRQEIVRRASEGPFALGECIAIATALQFGARLSERLALAEQAVWELLHMKLITLDGDGLGADAGTLEWQQVLLDWGAWSGARTVLVTAP